MAARWPRLNPCVPSAYPKFTADCLLVFYVNPRKRRPRCDGDCARIRFPLLALLQLFSIPFSGQHACSLNPYQSDYK